MNFIGYKQQTIKFNNKNVHNVINKTVKKIKLATVLCGIRKKNVNR